MNKNGLKLQHFENEMQNKFQTIRDTGVRESLKGRIRGACSELTKLLDPSSIYRA